jgi:hypothetical protein
VGIVARQASKERRRRGRRTALSGFAALGALVLALCLPPAGASESGLQFGVMIEGAPVDGGELQRLQQGGGTVIRANHKWRVVQPHRHARYDWGRYDGLVERAARADVSVLPVLIGSPDFAADEGAEPPTTRADKRLFERFVRAAVERYGRQGAFWRTVRGRLTPYRPITAWEVWNEPNLSRFWTGCRPRAREYAALLRHAHRAIAGADPRATVILGGMPESGRATRHGIPMSEYLDRLYSLRKIRPLFDVAAIHPYGATVGSVDAQLARVRRVMDASGEGGKQLWVTELGWGSSGPRHFLATDRDGQARLLAGAFSLLKERQARYRLGTAIWFRWEDPAPPLRPQGEGSWEDHAGLFGRSEQPKPAWEAFATATGGLPLVGPLPPDAPSRGRRLTSERCRAF